LERIQGKVDQEWERLMRKMDVRGLPG